MSEETKELAASFQCTIDAMRITKNGGCKLTLTIPENMAPKAVALALVPDALYEMDVFAVQNEVPVGLAAE